jgi:hypothetical protein
MAKRRTGLQKELSEILNGMSMPKGNNAERLVEPQIPLNPKSPLPARSLAKTIPPEAVEKLRRQQAEGINNDKIFKQISWQIFHSRAAHP